MKQSGPKLIPCIECRQPVSSDAKKCPNCGRLPYWFKSGICQKPAKQSESVCVYSKTIDGYWSHASCYQEVQNESFYCPVCHKQYSLTINPELTSCTIFNCHQCGHCIILVGANSVDYLRGRKTESKVGAALTVADYPLRYQYPYTSSAPSTQGSVFVNHYVSLPAPCMPQVLHKYLS